MATVTHHLYGNCQMIIALVNKIRKKHLLLKLKLKMYSTKRHAS